MNLDESVMLVNKRPIQGRCTTTNRNNVREFQCLGSNLVDLAAEAVGFENKCRFILIGMQSCCLVIFSKVIAEEYFIL